MKIVAVIQRILLGTIFLTSGIKGFVRFGHVPSFGTSIAREYMEVMQATPYGRVLFGVQILCGLMLIARVFVPVALTILAGYIFNIYMFDIFLDPRLSPWPVIVTVLWVFTFVRYRHAFRVLLLPRTPGP
jgi:putative oxidoreductase